MAVEREEKLSQRHLSQLAACIQRCPNDVLDPNDDAVVEDFR